MSSSVIISRSNIPKLTFVKYIGPSRLLQCDREREGPYKITRELDFTECCLFENIKLKREKEKEEGVDMAYIYVIELRRDVVSTQLSIASIPEYK